MQVVFVGSSWYSGFCFVAVTSPPRAFVMLSCTAWHPLPWKPLRSSSTSPVSGSIVTIAISPAMPPRFLRLERRGHFEIANLNLAVDHLFAKILEPVLREFFLDAFVGVRSLQPAQPLLIVLAAVVLRDNRRIITIGFEFEPEIIRRSPDVLTTNDDIGFVPVLVDVVRRTTVPIEKLLGLVVNFDIFPSIAHFDKGVDENFPVLTFCGRLSIF